MSSLSSSSLLSGHDDHYHITQEVFNTILNGVISGVSSSSLSLFPSLKDSVIDSAKEYLNNQQQDTALLFSRIRSDFRFFFFKFNSQIYQIITNLEVSVIHDITIV